MSGAEIKNKTVKTAKIHKKREGKDTPVGCTILVVAKKVGSTKGGLGINEAEDLFLVSVKLILNFLKKNCSTPILLPFSLFILKVTCTHS